MATAPDYEALDRPFIHPNYMPLPPLDGRGKAVGLVVVDQINPPRRYCIPTTDVLAVHKFVGVAESTGPGMARYRPQVKGA